MFGSACGAYRVSRVACVACVACRVSRAACRVSRVACRVSRVACAGKQASKQKRSCGDVESPNIDTYIAVLRLTLGWVLDRSFTPVAQ